MAKQQLLANVPVPIEVQYADLVDGQFGVQLRFKGKTPEDPRAMIYVDLVPANNALQAAGVITKPLDVPAVLPENGWDVTPALRVRRLVFERTQLAGEKRGRFVVRVDGAPTPTHETRASLTPNGPTGAIAPQAVRPKLATLYLECLEFALGAVRKRLDAADIGLSDQGAHAIAATLFIQRCKEERGA